MHETTSLSASARKLRHGSLQNAVFRARRLRHTRVARSATNRIDAARLDLPLPLQFNRNTGRTFVQFDWEKTRWREDREAVERAAADPEAASPAVPGPVAVERTSVRDAGAVATRTGQAGPAIRRAVAEGTIHRRSSRTYALVQGSFLLARFWTSLRGIRFIADEGQPT